jgi:hypothetical protein
MPSEFASVRAKAFALALLLVACRHASEEDEPIAKVKVRCVRPNIETLRDSVRLRGHL